MCAVSNGKMVLLNLASHLLPIRDLRMYVAFSDQLLLLPLASKRQFRPLVRKMGQKTCIEGQRWYEWAPFTSAGVTILTDTAFLYQLVVRKSFCLLRQKRDGGIKAYCGVKGQPAHPISSTQFIFSAFSCTVSTPLNLQSNKNNCISLTWNWRTPRQADKRAYWQHEGRAPFSPLQFISQLSVSGRSHWFIRVLLTWAIKEAEQRHEAVARSRLRRVCK